MNRFLKLARHVTPPPPGAIYADDRSILFPNVVSGSPRLRLWRAGAEVPTTGLFLLVGVATWSGYDMKLLDLIESAPNGPDGTGVFDVNGCRTAEDFEQYIPGLGSIYLTPAVGLWQDGHLTASGCGHEGRKIVCRAFGIDPARLPELLDPKSVPA